VQNIHNQIENKVKKSSKGKIFFAEDFLKFGTAENIRQVLRRLEKHGILVRLAHGIYLVPKKDEILGIVYPSIEEIAKEIAKRDKARIAPTGAMAMYLLGLSTQIPLHIVYLTDGAQREINIGKSKIKFKKTAPRNLAVKDDLLQLIIQAYKITGEKNISEDFEKKLAQYIKKIEDKVLVSQLKFAPVWIQKKIKNIHQS
jgi:predicted transcriptional regulator of viral defense system